MHAIRWSLPLALATALAVPAAGQTDYREQRVAEPPAEVPQYTVQRTGQGIRIDGRADEADWQATAPIRFIFPWNDVTKEKPQSTTAYMLWDDDQLYIAYVCTDPYLDSEVTAADGPVYTEDAVEIFVTPNAEDISAYFGYEMNINGALLDYIAFGGGTEWTRRIVPSWDNKGVQIATTYQGTLNDHSDTDTGWTLEIAIPFENFKHLGGQIPPQDGDLWRLNLNRTRGDKGQFSMWSDSRAERPSFHHSAYFGKAVFSDKAVGR